MQLVCLSLVEQCCHGSSVERKKGLNYRIICYITNSKSLMFLFQAHLDSYLDYRLCQTDNDFQFPHKGFTQGVWNVWTVKQTKVLNEPFR